MEPAFERLGYEARTHLDTMIGFAHLLADPALVIQQDRRARYAEAISRHGAALTASIDTLLAALTEPVPDGTLQCEIEPGR